MPLITESWQTRLHLPYAAHLDAAWFVFLGTILLSLGATFANYFLHQPATNQGLNSLQILKSEGVQASLRRFTILASAIGLIAWISSIYFAGGTLLTATNEGRFSLRGQGNILLVTVAIQFFPLSYSAGFFGWFHKSKPVFLLSFVYALTFSVSVFILSSGSRFIALAVTGGSLVGFLLSRPVSAKKLAAGFLLAIALVFLATVALPLRHRMNNMSWQEMATFVTSPDRLTPILTSDPLNYHDTCIQVLDKFPKRYDYVNAGSYRRLLFFPISSSFAPTLKPPDPNRDVAQALFGYERAKTVDWMHPPGLFGDLWINFWGWWSLPGFIAWGAIFTVANYYLIRSPKTLLFLGPSLFATCILYLRGQPYTLGLGILANAALVMPLAQLTGLSATIERCSRRLVFNRHARELNFSNTPTSSSIIF